MQVYLLRHGIAEEGTSQRSDADRALTNEGRRKLRQVFAHVADAGVKMDLVLTSPLKRALQTAEIAIGCLKTKPEMLISATLAPGGTVEDVWSEIRVHRDAETLLLVGQLKRPPRQIAEELVRDLHVDGVAAFEIAGNGYVNVRLDRGVYAAQLLDEDSVGDAPEQDAAKIVVEHTNINPNKAAHIGH